MSGLSDWLRDRKPRSFASKPKRYTPKTQSSLYASIQADFSKFYEAMAKARHEAAMQRTDKHGQLLHFGVRERTFGGPVNLCVEGYWLADGLMMTTDGTQVHDVTNLDVHRPGDCPS